MPTAKKFFNAHEQQVLINAITQAELKTSGEIRVHVENFSFGSELKSAEKIFKKLNMHQTKERNGVLIYIATLSRKIAVVGDVGIHQKLGSEFWQTLVAELIKQFKINNKAEALAHCILECGEQLGKFFPRTSDDTNELNNTISY
jgi:uncharacterized membrane protein